MMGRWTCLLGLVVLSFSFSLYQEGLAEERYIVKQGDSLYGISKAVGVPVETLKRANGLGNDRLRLKQVLVIPGHGEKSTAGTAKKQSGRTVKKSNGTAKKPQAEAKSYTVQKGDNLFAISRKFGLSVDEIKKTNHLASTALRTGQVLRLQKLTADTEEEGDDLDEGGEDPGTDAEEDEEAGAKQEAPVSVGAWKSPEERNLFVRVVKTFLGVPYRLGGSTLKGIDCSAFVKRIYEIFNIQLPRTTWEQFRIGKRVGKGELEEGDLVFFKTRTRRTSTSTGHVGIYIGNNQFVHASSHNREVKVDNLDEPYFNQRFLNGVRVKELREELTL